MSASVRVGARVLATVLHAAARMNPVARAPYTPATMISAANSFGPSLMPRSSMHQGMMMGLAGIAARSVVTASEAVNATIVPASAPYGRRISTRIAGTAIGIGLSSIPEQDDESLLLAGLRSGGLLMATASISGAIYDTGTEMQRRYPSATGIRPAIGAIALFGTAIAFAGRNLKHRKSVIERWPVEQKNELPQAIGIGVGVYYAGVGIGKGYLRSRDGLIRYLGPGATKNVLGRVGNGAVWAAGATVLYNAGVGYIGRANEKIEPAYATPPANPLQSGSAESVSPFADLGQQGRRFVTDVTSEELIEKVMGVPAKAQPIRTFIGYNSEPIYANGRAELALEELDRSGAFDRKYLLLLSPTGTGWVDQTLIEAVELMTRGNVATCCIQYGRFPSFLSLQKVALGRSQFRLLLWGVKERLRSVPAKKRPKVLVFGESLGAWTSSDVVMYQGIAGFDHYGIDKALWVGLPGLAKWSRNGMDRGANSLVPAGTAQVFDRPEQIEALSDEERDRLRAVILSHDNDPIAVVSPEMLIRKPLWFDGERGRGVPDDLTYKPLITFLQTAIDAMNAMVVVPGTFMSFGHDYRADMARFVRHGFNIPNVSEEQVAAVEEALVQLEIERGERVAAATAEDAPPPPLQVVAGERIQAGVPLQGRRTGGANWLKSILGGGTKESGDIQ